MINRPPADGFPPSPAPFPVPQPERPEPLITRVPLLGLKEYLDNYVFSYDSIYEDPGILPQDYELHEEANRIADYLYGADDKAKSLRTIGVGRIEGSGQKVIACSFGDIDSEVQKAYEALGYIVLREPRASGLDNHAERRLIREAEKQGYKLEAIGVSDRAKSIRGICRTCWTEMQAHEIRRASLLEAKTNKL